MKNLVFNVIKNSFFFLHYSLVNIWLINKWNKFKKILQKSRYLYNSTDFLVYRSSNINLFILICNWINYLWIIKKLFIIKIIIVMIMKKNSCSI